MRKRVGPFLILAAVLFQLAPWTTERVYSQQKGSGVAGGGRVARGSTHSSTPKNSPRDPSASGDEATGSISSHRILEIESLEQQCLDEINRVRRGSGLPRLNFYEELLPVAREYSRRMAEEHFFSHNDPDGLTVRE